MAVKFIFELWLCVIYVVKQTVSISSGNVNHRFESTIETYFPKGSHDSKMQIIFRVLGLQT